MIVYASLLRLKQKEPHMLYKKIYRTTNDPHVISITAKWKINYQLEVRLPMYARHGDSPSTHLYGEPQGGALRLLVLGHPWGPFNS